jgi:hypothetical protein
MIQAKFSRIGSVISERRAECDFIFYHNKLETSYQLYKHFMKKLLNFI